LSLKETGTEGSDRGREAGSWTSTGTNRIDIVVESRSAGITERRSRSVRVRAERASRAAQHTGHRRKLARAAGRAAGCLTDGAIRAGWTLEATRGRRGSGGISTDRANTAGRGTRERGERARIACLASRRCACVLEVSDIAAEAVAKAGRVGVFTSVAKSAARAGSVGIVLTTKAERAGGATRNTNWERIGTGKTRKIDIAQRRTGIDDGIRAGITELANRSAVSGREVSVVAVLTGDLTRRRTDLASRTIVAK
jgi:hypothetical protein